MFIANHDFALTTAADGATAGKSFLVNPQSSGIYVVARAYKVVQKYGVSETTQPKLQIQRMSSTVGAAAGAKQTTCRCLTSDGDSVGGVYDTVPTGVITAVAVLDGFWATVSGAATPDTPPAQTTPWIVLPVPQVLVAAEFLCARQGEGGSAAEDRRVNITWAWDEMTAAEVSRLRTYWGPRIFMAA